MWGSLCVVSELFLHKYQLKLELSVIVSGYVFSWNSFYIFIEITPCGQLVLILVGIYINVTPGGHVHYLYRYK